MSTLNMDSYKPQPPTKPSLLALSSKNFHIKHKHHHSAKQLPNSIQPSSVPDNQKIPQSYADLTQKRDIQEYYTHHHPLVQNKKSVQSLRKNSRLLLLKKEARQQNTQEEQTDLLRRNWLSPQIQQDRSSNQSSLGRGISIKRRARIIQKMQNRIKNPLQVCLSQQEIPNHEVSFEQAFQKVKENGEKLVLPTKIWSENVLGQGLKKHTSSKIKILVKNPFERHIRQREQLKDIQQAQHQKPTQFQAIKESEEIAHVDESFASQAYRLELQELVSMI